MSDKVISFQGQAAAMARREFAEAAMKTVRPLLEVSEVLKWHAWQQMEEVDEPDALAALEAWKAVANGIKAIEILAQMSEQWWSIAPGMTPDEDLFTLAVEGVADRFAPLFVEAMRRRDGPLARE